jgi:hypothetical protein
MEDNNKILKTLIDQLSSASAPPFLFVGSGFSQRYIGIPSWRELLSIFCDRIKPFKYYLAKSNNDLPTASSLMADDFFEMAWASDEFRSELENLDIRSKSDVIKFYISKYVSDLYEKRLVEELHPVEIQKLESLSVDSIITTNWDCFLEDLFQGYTTYVGQEELVSSNPHGIGEIYKIHGCVSRPSSMVLTKEDYFEFQKKYAYLAAKLATFLVEHPIVFVGYSLQDENVKQIVENLAACLGGNVQERLRNNLIFVQRSGNGRVDGIETTQFKVYDYNIPMTTVTTDDFGVVYDAIGSVKRKIPARILRFLKEEIYQIVKSNDPKSRICVADINDIDSDANIEFVVGVGVKELHVRGLAAQESDRGYNIIGIEELWRDVLESPLTESRYLDVKKLLEGTISFHINRSANTPIFKYLRMIGIDTDQKYQNSGLNFHKVCRRSFSAFHLKSGNYREKAEGNDIYSVIQKYNPQKAALIIPHLDIYDIDIDELEAFILTYIDEWAQDASPNKSLLRKLVAIYDRLKFGWLD